MKKQLLCINVRHQLVHALIALVLIVSTASSYAGELQYGDSWGKQGLSIKSQSPTGINLNFSMQHFAFEDRDVNGVTMKAISFSESLLPNDEGYPDLPGYGRYIAIPQGATPVVEIVNMRVEHFYNIDLSPAPRIPLDTETGPLQYAKKQEIYSKNAFYPAQPVMLEPTSQIRGIDVVKLNLMPFQYNPVTKELIVYRDMEINVRFEGGSRQFGDTKYRSPYWDDILSDVIFNYSALPAVDYDSRMANASRSVGYDYLIIVPNDPIFSQWGDSIKKFRNEEGIYTGMVKLSDIGTNVTPAMLETYINTAYNTWDIVPSAVLLLGDFGQASQNATSITSPIYDNYCVSDNILADIDGNHLPDIVFARITAQNAAQLQSMIGRFMKYERNPPTSPSFYQNPITALGWQTERWFQICSEVVGGFWKNSLGKTPVRINEVYQGTPGSIWSSAQNTNTVVGVFGPNGLGYIPQQPSTLGGWTGGNAAMINNAMNAGSFMLMHRDHGMETGWGEPSYTNANINSLTNTDLTWILSINCLTGKYNWSSECFTEKFHRYTYNGQPAGALGVTGASETSYSFVNDTYVWGMMDNMWPNFMPQYGTTPESRGVLPAFGNAAGKYFLAQSSWPYNTGNKEVTYHLFHHHGDAFMKVCTEVPQTIVATYNSTIYASETSVTVTTAPSAKICISAYGEILGTASTGMNTTVSITIPQQNIGTILKVTITKPNCNRYEGYITVVPDVTSAYAGEDASVCSDATVQLSATASNYSSLLWETSGTGTFDDATILNPVYTPGAEDLSAGSVILSLTASKPSLPDSTDYVTITFAPAPVAFAGNNANICGTDSYSTSEATAENYTELFWTTSGTGIFSDANALNTRYSPSAEDIAAGNVVLTLNISNGVCDVHTSDVPLTINPKPFVTISGATIACQNQADVIYTAGSSTNTYAWEAVGGTITSGTTANEVTVTWTEAGLGTVYVTETNEFGCSQTASYEVTLNAAPAPSISGNAAVCANSTNALYATTMVEGNTYTWNITGGTIISGGTSNEVSVDWGENGTGTLNLVETNTANQCSTSLDYAVAIASPVVNLGQDTTICINHSFVLKAAPGYASYTWSTGATTPDITINGEQYTVASVNNFEVTVTDAQGCQTVESIAVTIDACTGIGENPVSEISIYPNPTNGEFNLIFSEDLAGEANIKVVDLTGKVLFNRSINVTRINQTETFNVTGLSSGLYFIRVESNQGTNMQKLIIE